MQMLDIEHTLGPEIAADSWHNDLVRVNLTKNMDAVFPEVRDEVASAFEDYIPLCDDGEQRCILFRGNDKISSPFKAGLLSLPRT